MITSCAEERKPPIHDPAPPLPLCEEGSIVAPSTLYELYTDLTTNHKFVSGGMVIKKITVKEKQLDYYQWPTLSYVEGVTKGLTPPLDKLIASRSYCLREDGFLFDTLEQHRCLDNCKNFKYLSCQQIPYEKFIALEEKFPYSYKGPYLTIPTCPFGSSSCRVVPEITESNQENKNFQDDFERNLIKREFSSFDDYEKFKDISESILAKYIHCRPTDNFGPEDLLELHNKMIQEKLNAE